MSETISPTYRTNGHVIERDGQVIGVTMRPTDAIEIVGGLNFGQSSFGPLSVGFEQGGSADLYANEIRLAAFFDFADAELVAEALNRAGGQGE
ncbi:hypothetical protein [Kineosporia succinea]|uniref:Uncharacterized protein n=1 Tax=Kineosporia succinea TaxID=84632 RepID=A0ABT9PAZ9_9ACTN|nr:hypothetical protein [Kineosporia succinea]MDP9829365.1 hypothetical protein [Kineosporia succinea]